MRLPSAIKILYQMCYHSQNVLLIHHHINITSVNSRWRKALSPSYFIRMLAAICLNGQVSVDYLEKQMVVQDTPSFWNSLQCYDHDRYFSFRTIGQLRLTTENQYSVIWNWNSGKQRLFTSFWNSTSVIAVHRYFLEMCATSPTHQIKFNWGLMVFLLCQTNCINYPHIGWLLRRIVAKSKS